MNYVTAAAFRAAIEARLTAEARTANVTLDRLRKMVVFERLLARLIAVAPGRWILKGGLALDYRLGYFARTTRDIDLGRAGSSTRVKDLVDLVLLLEHETFEAARLRQALEATFTVRGTHSLPAAFPPPPGNWRTPFGRLAREVGVASDLEAAHRRAAAFLDPVLDGNVVEAVWDKHSGGWVAAVP